MAIAGNELVLRITRAYAATHPSLYSKMEWRMSKVMLLCIAAEMNHPTLNIDALDSLDGDELDSLGIQLYGIPVHLHGLDELLLVMVV